MAKTILITGSTDGIGLATARMLAEAGHRVILHGRSREKLDAAAAGLSAFAGGRPVERHVADLSRMPDVAALADAVAAAHPRLDVLINNAGVYNAPVTLTAEGFDIRFAVNTIAPYLLTRRLLPRFGPSGRIVNLSSAAQAKVDHEAIFGRVRMSNGMAYAQSKLALTMWTRALATELGAGGPVLVAVNPGSMLGSKLVQEAFGVAGGDIRIGAEILTRAALSDEFAAASGAYFDNDIGRFAEPHPDATDPWKSRDLVRALEAALGEGVD
ncbi:SDR family NAD(P)-dependent oxidoreductase [Paralimibaculum aggregatum]|uniref:SDR family NAD(P)-dependent oxidoreductase n=1 Tax=Paralimibaculum aggregatum TaxID=3036245 RepID=A0ABQ6LGJ7_9RHOB|nr:SDR family NAD(P)-dependent oxidoreductase [Limibaculum sp. NKW23]GMG82427.1 SDR family NAD(P)-dependent oxidoreductase [Limibaculum sp. NKW23]